MMPARSSLALLFVLGCSAAEGSLDPDANAPSPDGGATTTPDATPFTPALASSKQLCKLLSDRNVNDPSANDVQHAANVLGADLGIPVVASDKLYLLFGDTIGYAGIWPGSESHPDSVGYGLDSATAIAADPSLLCDRMRIVSLPPSQSLGPSVNSSVKADFAGAAMIAPSGHSLGEYIRNPAGSGSNVFPQLPGDFEVPSGAFSVNGSIYVFYTTVVGPGQVDMKASYLAKWVQPTTSGAFGYQVLYQVDERFDGNGAMHGNFVNVAAEVVGDYLYVFGTGEYRRSKIHAARKPLAQLEQPGGFEDLGEIVGTAGYGEISVHYYPSIGRWMLLAEESLPASNHIVAYFSEKPEGPWGTPFVVHDMGDGAFRAKYCCSSEDNCLGVQMFNCNRTGFYGTYLFPTLIETANELTITYTMSSFSPYNVALFQTTFTK